MANPRFLITLAAALSAGMLPPAPFAGQKQDAELKALDDQLPGTLANDPRSLDWAHYGPGCSKEPVVDQAIPGGGAALRLTVAKAGANPWDCGLSIPLLTRIDKDEVVTIGMWIRLAPGQAEGAKGTITLRFQETVAPYAGFGDATREVGPRWEWVEISAVADRAMPKGKASVAIQLAGMAQVLEIGQAIVVKGALRIAS